MSNLMTSASAEASVSSSRRAQTTASIYPQQLFSPPNQPQPPPKKKKRNLPGNPDPDAEVIALSPKSLLATNRFVCEICGKGFQRDQNLQLHRRGHNLPWKLKQRTGKEVRKKVYVCPEAGCVHHHPSRALGDLTGIKKHFSRKHGEKKWKCEKCTKRYAVQSDWKAHSKTCGTREYRCDCGTLFSRRDSFITHRAFCDALAEESTRAVNTAATLLSSADPSFHVNHQLPPHFGNGSGHAFSMKREQHNFGNMPPWLACPGAPPPLLDHVGSSLFSPASLDDDRDRQLAATRENPNPSLPPYQPTVVSPQMSATALLQKAARMGASLSTKTGALPVMMRPHHQPLPHVSAGSANNTTGFGPNLSTPEEMASGFVSVSGSASFGNKAALSSGLPDHTGAGAGSGASAPPLLQDVMMTSFSSPTGFGGSSSGGILMNSKDLIVPGTTLSHRIIGMADNHEVGDASTGTSSDAMTRDFLGLRSLSRSHILNMAALANCITPPHHNQNHNQNPTQKSWQG